jgi:FAD synthetase
MSRLASTEGKTVSLHSNLCVNIQTLDIVGTVLLHLYAAVLAQRLGYHNTMKPIPALYISVPSPFPKLEKFIEESVHAYNLDLFHCTPPMEQVESVSTPPAHVGGTHLTVSIPLPVAVGKAKGGEGMRQALGMYKSRFPHITAILIGTRRTDPHGGTYCPIQHRD